MSKLVSFKLDEWTDKDLIRWLESQGNQSSAIREALREHLTHNGVTLGDVYSKLCDLERNVKSGVVVSDDSMEGGEYNEPPDVAAALDALADL